MDRLLEAARASGAEAVHPGYGFLSENWRFARACEEAGLVWIGPPWPVIRDMGDKVGARRLMAAAGVPVVPGSEGVVETVDAAREVAARVGYPIFLKAAAGGGGIGMARVADESALAAAFATAQRRSQAAFGTRGALRRALPRGPAPRRGAGHGRSARRRRAPARARVLDPAAPPEADRGDAGARAVRRAQGAPHGGGGERRARRRLRQRGDDGVHRPGRGILLSRDEHPAAGRAPGHGGSDGRRSRPGPASGGLGRAPAVGAARDRPAGREHRVPDLRGGSRQELPALARADHAARRCPRARESASSAASPKASRCRYTTTRSSPSWWRRGRRGRRPSPGWRAPSTASSSKG